MLVKVQKLDVSFFWRFLICPAFFDTPARPSAEILRVEALSLWRRAILLLAKWPLEVVSWFAGLLSQSRGRGFDSPLVCGSSGLKIAAFTRSVLSCSSGWKIATFKYRRGMRSVLPQLRLENRNFQVQT